MLAIATRIDVGVVVISAAAAQLALLLIIGVKVSRQIRWSTEETDRNLKDTYWQLESLQYVLAEVKPKQPLPAAREWALSPDALKALVQLIRQRRPKLVLETGSGISTIVTAYLLKQQGGGKVISLDQDADFGARTQEAIRQHGLGRYAEVRSAPLTTQRIDGKDWKWYDPKTWRSVGKIDFLTVDGPVGSLARLSRWPAVPLLKDKLKPDAVILLDDADRDDEKIIGAEWKEMLTGSSLHRLPTEKGTVILTRKPRKHGISL